MTTENPGRAPKTIRDVSCLSSNTSSIPLETLGQGLRHQERLVGLHFFNPVAKKMQLVEVIHTEITATEATSIRIGGGRG